MIRRIGLLALGLSLSLAGSARAQDDGFSSATGAYVSLGGTYANENLQSNIGGTGTSRNLVGVSNASDTGGIRLGVGLQGTEWSAFETTFTWLQGFDFDALQGGSPVSRDGDVFSFQWNARFFPLFWVLDEVLQGRIQPYIVGGPGLLAASDTGLKTPVALALQAGGGVKVHITERIAFEADATYMWPAIENLEGLEYVAVTGALVYRFGE